MHINFDLRNRDKGNYCRTGRDIPVDSGARRADVRVTLFDHKVGEREYYYAVELRMFGITITVDADADAYADLGEMAAESRWIERTFDLSRKMHHVEQARRFSRQLLHRLGSSLSRWPRSALSVSQRG